MNEFVPFPKLGRLSNDWIVTEKIDGTNAQIHILDDGRMLAGSRNRYVTEEDDNYGFARWVKKNQDDLALLGPGRHYGEWYGRGIQRNYGLEDRRFALFNVGRWTACERPECCEVVPLLWQGRSDELSIFKDIMSALKESGSNINNFPDPEGIVMFHRPTQTIFKKTYEYDEKGKGQIKIE